MRLSRFTPALFTLIISAIGPAECGPHQLHPNAGKRGYQTNSGLVSASFLPGWRVGDGFDLSTISWHKYTQIIYAFAMTTPDNGLSLNASNGDQLPAFVSAAKENNVLALASVGGWTGSGYFSTAFGSAENRTAFVKTLLDFAQKYDLDGLAMDYEYPARQGIGCNTIDVANDLNNYLLFLQEFRADPVGAQLYLSATGSVFPWYGPSGTSATDLSGFASVLDHIAIMAYDLYGPWARTAGPNAPIYSACDTRNDQGSADSGISQWIAAGIPAEKILLGVAGYGHGFTVNATSAMNADGTLNMYPYFNASDRRMGDRWDDAAGVDRCGQAQPAGGIYNFWGLIENGFLNEDGTPADGIQYGFDDCAKTPAVYNATKEIWVSYDSAESIQIKGEWLKSKGFAGFAMWNIAGDSNDILIDAVRTGAGIC